jgi:hypothetical protein
MQNGQKIYQKYVKYTKWEENIPKGCNTYIPNGHKINQTLPLQASKNLRKLGFFV